MKIVHIGTADNSGGAARASFQLHEGLLRLGHESRMLVGQKFEERPEIERIGFSRSLRGRVLDRFVLELETRTGLQNLIQPKRRAFLAHRFVTEADIIHLHNLHGNFFCHTILPSLSKIAPIVWTLHDTWALTGHCSYNYDCGRWETGCGKCPNLDEYPSIKVDTTAFLWRVKERVYRHADLHIVAPSKWLSTMALQSPLLKSFRVHCIPYGIDTQIFHPIDRSDARNGLAIPPDATVVMIIGLPGGQRKGVEYLLTALDRLKTEPKPWLLIVGSRGLLNAVGKPFPIRELGYVESREIMNLCFSAADLFVLPTLADNFPVTLLEALAAGTPPIAFDVGGVPDIVRHMETGYLAAYKDAEDLARGIDLLLTDGGLRERLGRCCREVVESEYSMELQARRFEKLYQDIIRERESAQS